jgi:hypothetical protein
VFGLRKKFVRSRLSSDEVWLIYRLIDNQYWLLRRHAWMRLGLDETFFVEDVGYCSITFI